MQFAPQRLALLAEGKSTCEATRQAIQRLVGAYALAVIRNGHSFLVGAVPGGAGKTRLAIEAAGRVSGSFPDGVWFVDIAQVATPETVVEAVASALRLYFASVNSALMPSLSPTLCQTRWSGDRSA